MSLPALSVVCRLDQCQPRLAKSGEANSHTSCIKKKCATQRTLPTETARGQWSNGDKRGRRRDGERKRDACCCHLPPWTLPTNLRPKPHLTNEYRDAEHRHGPSATTLTMHIHHSIESKGNGVCVRERGRKKRKHYKMKKEKKIVQ